MAAVDLALCGGGLQNALIVAALCGEPAAAAAWPRIALVERDEVGGNHTWCCYDSDLSPAMQRRVAPFVTQRWSRYEVRFPGYRRILDTAYSMISSTRLRSAVRALLAARGNALLWERTPVERVSSAALHLTDGRELRARMVIDARGARPPGTECGYQKFYGQEVTLREPHGLTCPIVMDATVAQHDGFRFMYVLPLGERRALLEDTTFSDGPDLDEEQRQRGIAAWLHRHGWHPAAVTRTERGVLPMPLRMPAAPGGIRRRDPRRLRRRLVPPRHRLLAAAGRGAGGAGGGDPGGRPRGGSRRRPRAAAPPRPLLLPAQPAAVPGLPGSRAARHLRTLLSTSGGNHQALLRHAPQLPR